MQAKGFLAWDSQPVRCHFFPWVSRIVRERMLCDER